jgi:tetratricopeptide (TPR) repeat protein
MSDANQDPALERALAEIEALKARVAELGDDEARSEERSWKTWVAAAGTASVTLLAFLIPSLQEQWDRLHQRAAIEDYREVAHALMGQGKFHDAEQTLARAIELSDQPRLDLERERLVAKTSEVNADPAWSGRIADELEETDFSVLEAMQARAGEHAARAWTLNNHAVFLANHAQAQRALTCVQEAAREAPSDARIQVTLGNVRWDLGQLDDAARAYHDALASKPNDLVAHYNLGLLYEERGQTDAARAELRRVLDLRPDDAARDDLARLDGDEAS